MDRCRVWESHSNANDRCHVAPTLTGTRSVCPISDQPVKPVDLVTVVGATPPVELTLLQRVLLSVPEPAPPPCPAPGGMETMLKRLLLLTPVPASTPWSAFTVRETGPLRPLPPGTPTSVPRLSPILTHKDWTTMVCFSCGRSGHGVSRCPQLDEKFSYLLPGWSVERRDGQCMAVSPRTITERLQSGNDD